jgi:hypothetical protein
MNDKKIIEAQEIKGASIVNGYFFSYFFERKILKISQNNFK